MSKIKENDDYEKNRKNKKRVCIRLSDEEYELLKNKVAQTSFSTTTYIRKLIVEEKVVKYDFGILTSCRKEMHRIGSNVNQMAKRLNSTSDMFIEDVDEIREHLSELDSLLTFRKDDRIAAEYIRLLAKVSDIVSMALVECDMQKENEEFNPRMILFYLNYIKELLKDVNEK